MLKIFVFKDFAFLLLSFLGDQDAIMVKLQLMRAIYRDDFLFTVMLRCCIHVCGSSYLDKRNQHMTRKSLLNVIS